MPVYLVAYDIKNDGRTQNFRNAFVSYIENELDSHKVLDTTYFVSYDGTPKKLHSSIRIAADRVLGDLNNDGLCKETELNIWVSLIAGRNQYAGSGCDGAAKWISSRLK